MSIDYVAGDDHVVTITINRPEARNSMDAEHFFRLRSAWERFGEDDDAYVAIVTGVGQDFCVGADLKTYIPQLTALQERIDAGTGSPKSTATASMTASKPCCAALSCTSRSSPP